VAVSDHVPDSPTVTESWCPTCAPDRDPLRELLEERWCGLHAPSLDGALDKVVRADLGYLSGSAEAEANDCQRIQRLIR
jgi:hypothetical protein